jgi:K+/H+ antiporter YhaU regulatory subunit KhtT
MPRQADYTYADAVPAIGDLLHLNADIRSDLAEKVDRGQISLSDDKLQTDHLVIQLRQETANRQAAAQEARAEQTQQFLVIQAAMPKPYMLQTPPRAVTTNCYQTGNMVNCTSQ